MSAADADLLQRIRRDLADSYEEELELEDHNPDPLAESGIDVESLAYQYSRGEYFRELFRMQG